MKGIQIALLVQKLPNFAELVDFAYLWSFSGEGSASAACTAGLFWDCQAFLSSNSFLFELKTPIVRKNAIATVFKIQLIYVVYKLSELSIHIKRLCLVSQCQVSAVGLHISLENSRVEVG